MSHNRTTNQPLVIIVGVVCIIIGIFLACLLNLCPCPPCDDTEDCIPTCLFVRFVDDVTGEPIEGVYVGIYDANGTIVCQGYTDANGDFLCNVNIFGCGGGEVKVAYVVDTVAHPYQEGHVYLPGGEADCIIHTGTGCCRATITI